MENNNEECDANTKVVLEAQAQNMVLVNKIYIKRLEYAINKIEKIVKKENKDRLDYSYIIDETVKLLAASTEGWRKWCNLRTMHDVMTDKDLEEVAPKMFALMKKWIEIDIQITKEKTVEDEKKLKDKRHKKEENYVS